MKQILLLVFASVFFTFPSSKANKIKFASNVKYGKAYLAYYIGKNINVEDSAAISPIGTAIFNVKKSLLGGIYLIVFGNKRFSIEFLMDDSPLISIKTDTSNLAYPLFTGSKANDIFQKYQKFVVEKGMLMDKEKKSYNEATSDADRNLHEKAFKTLSSEVQNFRNSIIVKEPESLLAILFQAMKPSEMPAYQLKNKEDSFNQYQYYKSHYWDAVNFADDRIIRTPFFIPKLEDYYRGVMPQIPDSLIKDIDYKLLLARTEPEMYKFLLNWFTDEFLNPKYMGLDAVFVHLYEKYHSKGVSTWLNESQMKTITTRAYMQMANLLGKNAANISMLDVKDKPINLYDVDAEYILLLFWEPSCGHCKTELPRIDSIYRANWKQKGMKIFAVLNEDVHSQWLDFIKDNQLEEWVNVYLPKSIADSITASGQPGYRQLFDVTMTPTLLLLDKEKRIIAKKLDWEQINDFLEIKSARKNTLNK